MSVSKVLCIYVLETYLKLTALCNTTSCIQNASSLDNTTRLDG
jgi:hypothetical protein